MQFCADPKQRLNLSKPFTRGAYTFASNGTITVRVPASADYPEADNYADAPKSTGPAFAVFERPANEILTPWPFSVGDFPTDEVVSCKACDGSGFELCSKCNHPLPDEPCEDCNGAGVTSALRWRCVKIRTRWLPARYAHLIMLLPGAQFSATGGSRDQLYFEFEGGAGVVMPMLITADYLGRYEALPVPERAAEGGEA
jgi:hypothetical protein